MALTFALVAEAFVCLKAKADDAAVECCDQFYPRHHLVLLAAIFEEAYSQAFIEDFGILIMNLLRFLVLDPIFHPPKMLNS